VTPLPPEAVSVPTSKREAVRVPFLAVVEAGLLRPGAVLTDDKGRHAAVVKLDGSIVRGDFAGSIHAVGARVQGLQACNGWSYWHFEENGRRYAIDKLRGVLRAKAEFAAKDAA
jgi:modification methylase